MSDYGAILAVLFGFKKKILRIWDVKEGLRDNFALHLYNYSEVRRMRDIGKNIRDLRKSAGMTQEEMAERLFMTRQTVSNYETGKSRPDVEMIVRIGELFGADANTVIYGPADEVPVNRTRRIIRAIVIILTCMSLILLNKWVVYHRANTYLCLPYTAVKLLLNPATYVVVGWWAFDEVLLILRFKSCPITAWSPYIHRVAICLLTVTVLFILPQIISAVISDYHIMQNESFSISNPFIPLISDIEKFSALLNLRFPALYMVFGIILRMTGFSNRK